MSVFADPRRNKPGLVINPDEKVRGRILPAKRIIYRQVIGFFFFCLPTPFPLKLMGKMTGFTSSMSLVDIDLDLRSVVCKHAG